MRIGRVAKLSGLTVKAVRFYEETGLLGEVLRRGSYRDFTAADVDRLKLITHCRGLGFSVADIQGIVGLLENSEGACPDAAAMLTFRRIQATFEEVRKCMSGLREHRSSPSAVA